MIYLVPTIPNTGSHFITEHILPYQNIPLKQIGVDDPEYAIVFDHMHPRQTGLFVELMERYPAIVPLRHPKVVARSWQLRGKDMEDFHIMWRESLMSIDAMGPYYLPLDVPDRQDYLDRLKEIGIDRETDWPEIGSQHRTSNNRAEMIEYDTLEDGDRVRETVAEIRPFLDRFYT